jgi:selenide,water dikinase
MAKDVLVGLEAPDDAAVYALDDQHALVTTVDFFTPVVDDPYTFGAIAAANAMSDIYAMGGRPLFALNIVAFPIDDLDRSVLIDILRGGSDKASEAGVAIIGGHSIDDKEPKYGMAVTGVLPDGRIYRKSDGRAGDDLVLTKAIGTGVISTAIKRGTAAEETIAAVVNSMLRLNDRAAALAKDYNVGCITDVTGFGLLGHLSEVAKLSGVTAVVEYASVPTLPDALKLASEGAVPGGSHRNQQYIEPITHWDDSLSDAERILLCDAQTSGGLLISVDPEDSPSLVRALVAEGHAAARIGGLGAGESGGLEVR